MDRDRLGEVLRIVANGLRPFVEAEMRRVHGEGWEKVARSGLPPHMASTGTDLSFFLAVINAFWSSVFRSKLSFVDRSYTTELRDFRNRWAHQEQIPPADIDRAIDTARRLLRAVNAQGGLIEIDALTGVTRPGISRVPATPRTPVHERTSSKPKGHTHDWTAPAEDLIESFISTFGQRHRRFGSKSLGLLGVSDDAQGPQWSVAMDLHSGRTWLAVNLEGMQYNGWPIARFIERELASPELPELKKVLATPEQVIVAIWRDAWQAAGRVKIVEREIAPSPIAMASISRDQWRSVLQDAHECLDPQRGHRGRRRTTVTLAGSHQAVVREVSPHLNIKRDLHRNSPSDDWAAVIKTTREELEAVHNLVVRKSQ